MLVSLSDSAPARSKSNQSNLDFLQAYQILTVSNTDVHYDPTSRIQRTDILCCAPVQGHSFHTGVTS